MAKVKLPLEMANGVMARTIGELRDNFDIKKVVGHFLDGKLKNWLEARYYEEELEKVNELSESDPELAKKLCEILGVEYTEENIDIDSIQEKNERLLKLKQYTDDEEIIANIDSVAFNQEELAALYDKDVKTIYLCGEKFIISTTQRSVYYIGINEPTVMILELNEIDFQKLEICFEKVKFDEQTQNKILPKFERAVNWHKEKNYVEAKKLFEKYAEKGNAKAMWYLGLYYEYGYGIESNIEKAYEWYLEGAEAGNPKAMNAVAICYEKGIGTQKNTTKAAEWYKKGADTGEMYAMYNYARCCENGIGIRSSEDRSSETFLFWYEKSAELGHPNSMGILANHYRFYSDYNKAIYWAKKGEKNNNEESIEVLVSIYDRTQQYEKVFALLEPRAQKGDIRAMITLWDWYSTGRVVLKPYRNYERSYYWLKKAAEAGDYSSIHELGFRYAGGCFGVSENEAEARRWYAKESTSKRWSSYKR